jgi:hypothetical protein
VDTRGTIVTIATTVAVICIVGWIHAHQQLREAEGTYLSDTLDPVSELLKENSGLTHELESAAYSEPGSQFVAAYLIKIRRDGVGKHSDMKQKIDRLVNNNTAILALLAKYSTHARTAPFRAEVERFRDYAISLRDRWQSVPEIFMAGGGLPVAGPQVPADFLQAIVAEAR